MLIFSMVFDDFDDSDTQTCFMKTLSFHVFSFFVNLNGARLQTEGPERSFEIEMTHG